MVRRYSSIAIRIKLNLEENHPVSLASRLTRISQLFRSEDASLGASVSGWSQKQSQRPYRRLLKLFLWGNFQHQLTVIPPAFQQLVPLHRALEREHLSDLGSELTLTGPLR